ncbi:MAG: hypothetical protein ABFS02_03700, partial [Pseudomonadota bacterium]
MISPERWRSIATRYQWVKKRLWIWAFSLMAFILVFNLLPLGRTRVGYFLSLLLLMALSEIVITAGVLSFFRVPQAKKTGAGGGRSKLLEWVVALGAPVLLILVPVMFLTTLYGQ